MKKQIFIVCLIAYSLFPATAFATPVINEFSSSTSDDWIEIYNPDAVPIDLSIYRIRDSTENNKLDLSGSLAPLSLIAFEWTNKLNNGGDIIKLVQIFDNSTVDQIIYGNQGGLIAPDINQSAGRISDGAGNWTVFTTASKNSTNNSSSAFVPPTPTPSKTPIPTKTPTAPKTVTSQPSKNPTLSKSTSTSSVISRIPTRSSSNTGDSGKIAQSFERNNYIGIRNLTEAPEVSSKTEVKGARDRKFPVITLIGGVLLIFAGVLAFSLRYINPQELYEKIFNK